MGIKKRKTTNSGVLNKLGRKGPVLIIAAAVLLAGAATIATAYTLEQSRQSAHKTTNPQTNTESAEGKASSVVTPTLTPKPPTPTPTRNVEKPNPNNVPVQKNSSFTIASVTLWPKQVVCDGGPGGTVYFNTLTATRHYQSGGGGTANLLVEYSDGTSTPVSLTFASSNDTRTYSGLSHKFNTNAHHTYRVRVLSPSPITTSWMSIGPGNCAAPSPSPTPWGGGPSMN